MPSQSQKYVIVGGAGLVGSALARHLADVAKVDVIICDDFGDVDARKWASLPHNLADIWPTDTLLPNLDKAWRDVSGVIVLGDAGPFGDDADCIFELAYHLPRAIWDFCVAKQRPMFWASSAHVYGAGPSNLSTNPADLCAFKPVNAFGRAKLAFDIFAARQGNGPDTPPIVAGFRLSSVYGPNESHKGEQASLVSQMLEHARTGNTLELWENSADIARDWVHVDDAAAAMAEIILGQKSGFFDIGTGQQTRTSSLIALVESTTKRTINHAYSLPQPYGIVQCPGADVSLSTTKFRTLNEGLASL
jgi:nucleoside-diphosphate-sugar epimerase